MKSELISEQILSDDEISIDCSEINSSVDSILTKKLKEKLEGNCITSGYVMKDSIELINRSKYGECYKGKTRYNISFKTRLVSPVVGLNIECYINSITKAGVVAYIKLDDYGNYEGNKFEDSPLLILIPLNRFEGKNIQENTKINVEITAFRIMKNNKTIQVIGRPI